MYTCLLINPINVCLLTYTYMFIQTHMFIHIHIHIYVHMHTYLGSNLQCIQKNVKRLVQAIGNRGQILGCLQLILYFITYSCVCWYVRIQAHHGVFVAVGGESWMTILPSAMFKAQPPFLCATVYSRLALEHPGNFPPPTLHFAVGLPGL